MIHAGQALSILGEPETDHHRAKRFNSLLAGLAAQGRIHNFVAAPFACARLPSTSPKMLKLVRCWTAGKTIAVDRTACARNAQAPRHLAEPRRQAGHDPIDQQLMRAEKVKSSMTNCRSGIA